METRHRLLACIGCQRTRIRHNCCIPQNIFIVKVAYFKRLVFWISMFCNKVSSRNLTDQIRFIRNHRSYHDRFWVFPSTEDVGTVIKPASILSKCYPMILHKFSYFWKLKTNALEESSIFEKILFDSQTYPKSMKDPKSTVGRIPRWGLLQCKSGKRNWGMENPLHDDGLITNKPIKKDKISKNKKKNKS